MELPPYSIDGPPLSIVASSDSGKTKLAGVPPEPKLQIARTGLMTGVERGRCVGHSVPAQQIDDLVVGRRWIPDGSSAERSSASSCGPVHILGIERPQFACVRDGDPGKGARGRTSRRLAWGRARPVHPVDRGGRRTRRNNREQGSYGYHCHNDPLCVCLHPHQRVHSIRPREQEPCLGSRAEVAPVTVTPTVGSRPEAVLHGTLSLLGATYVSVRAAFSR